MKRLARSTLKWTLYVLAMTAIVEVSLRVVFPGKVRERRDAETRIANLAYAFHPDYLIRLRPGVTKTFTRTAENGGERIEWRANSHGFRGEELDEDPELRVIVYGDSNVQARFSVLERSLTGRLERELGALTGKRVEVLNAGVLGAGPDQHLLRFTAEAGAYEPDIVVVNLFADNDFGDLIRNRLFELDANGELVKTTHHREKDRALRLPHRLLVVRAVVEVIERLPGGTRSVFVDTNGGIEREFAQRLEQMALEYAVYERGAPRTFSHFSDHYDVDISTDPDGAAAKTKTALMDRVLGEMKRVAATKGVRLVVLIEPSAIDLTQKYALNYRFLARDPDYRPDRLTSIVQEICTRREIPHLNLYRPFVEGGPERLFFRGADNHWNDDGQALAAKEAAAFIHRRFFADVSRDK